jgi:hypothetical protein
VFQVSALIPFVLYASLVSGVECMMYSPESAFISLDVVAVLLRLHRLVGVQKTG